MEQKFEGFMDNMLERIFGGFEPQLLLFNVVLSVVFIVFGVFLLKKQVSKSRNIIGWTCFTIGSLGIISGIVQFIKI
ncbi:MAG: hypothetical protein JJT76_20000 [Clostridiaceae bacterium]|nr:hypothetical protein [Clostridiaceae bacterium]